MRDATTGVGFELFLSIGQCLLLLLLLLPPPLPVAGANVTTEAKSQATFSCQLLSLRNGQICGG
jgi:hypothetical protein